MIRAPNECSRPSFTWDARVVLDSFRRITDLISDDPSLRRRQRAALLTVAASIPLTFISGFVGAAVLFGDPGHQHVWTVIAVAGLVLGFSLATGGNVVWQWTRMRDARKRGTDEPPIAT